MEYIYGPPPPPPPSSGSSSVMKKNASSISEKRPGNNKNNREHDNKNRNQVRPSQPLGNYLDLPTHLPNALPSQQPEIDEHNEPQQETKVTIAEKETVPVFGTNIVLKTEEDIQEWIKQRKSNWMKKISNSRPETEDTKVDLKITDKTSPKRTQRSDDRIRNQNQNRVQKPSHSNHQNNSSAHLRPNLNRLLIQREIQHENKAILDVIKELFDHNILQN